MSKPRYHWYGIVKHMTCRYYDMQDCHNMQEYIFHDAINKALEATDKLSYPDKRKWAIEQVLFLQRRTVAGVAYDLHFSEYTVQRWLNNFINKVGEYAGFSINEP